MTGGSYCQQATEQPLQFAQATQALVESRLRAYTRKNLDREPALRRVFVDAGCTGDALSEQIVKGTKAPNLICTYAGATDSKIVVGAHSDLVEAGSGVVDNWSGTALLPTLYQGLAGAPRKHTYVFVAFSGEESGLLGSKAFLKELSERREAVRAMVNMDSLGLAETEIWVSHSDKELVSWLVATAKAMNLPITGMNVDEVGVTDSEPFRERKIPAITVHSGTQDTLKILHSPSDQLKPSASMPTFGPTDSSRRT